MGGLTQAYALIGEHNKRYGHKADIYRHETTTNNLGQPVLGELKKVYSNVSLTYKERRYPPKDLTVEGIKFSSYYDASINSTTDDGDSVILQDRDKVYIGNEVYDIIEPKLEPFGYMALMIRQ
ncbi:MAG: hypothetical protein WC942_04830 [Clostridia bacterium]|jgi:hypothetical protein